MVEVFGATSTTEDVLSGVNLHNKRILVTGISAGLGVETARSLAAHGAQVVGAARDLTKAEAATMQVRKDAAAGGGGFELIELDLASLKSVRACTDKLLAKGELLDVVIANAGVMATPFGHTADGFETQFGTNHLGHFVLLVDEHRQAYVIADLGSANLLHMLRRDNFKSRDRARAAGHHQHKLGPNPFQLGGGFIFAAGNIDRFACQRLSLGVGYFEN